MSRKHGCYTIFDAVTCSVKCAKECIERGGLLDISDLIDPKGLPYKRDSPLHMVIRVLAPEEFDRGERLEIVKTLIEHGIPVDVRDKNDETPLHTACYSTQVECVEFLLRQGANPNAKDDEGNTPLHSLLFHGDYNHPRDNKEEYQKITSIINLLLSFGADPNITDNKGRTPYQIPKVSEQTQQILKECSTLDIKEPSEE